LAEVFELDSSPGPEIQEEQHVTEFESPEVAPHTDTVRDEEDDEEEELPAEAEQESDASPRALRLSKKSCS